MFEVKLFEIRDRLTTIPAMATRLSIVDHIRDPRSFFLLKLAGYGQTTCIMLQSFIKFL